MMMMLPHFTDSRLGVQWLDLHYAISHRGNCVWNLASYGSAIQHPLIRLAVPVEEEMVLWLSKAHRPLGELDLCISHSECYRPQYSSWISIVQVIERGKLCVSVSVSPNTSSGQMAQDQGHLQQQLCEGLLKGASEDWRKGGKPWPAPCWQVLITRAGITEANKGGHENF